jgi:hypothetical protein
MLARGQRACQSTTDVSLNDCVIDRVPRLQVSLAML